MRSSLITVIFSIFFLHSFSQQVKGPSSSQTPYLSSSLPGAKFASIITAGDAANNGYKMAGIPDGLGAFDNGNGTFTLLMNHEIASSLGAVRGHGAKGAFISKWIINKNGFACGIRPHYLTTRLRPAPPLYLVLLTGFVPPTYRQCQHFLTHKPGWVQRREYL
jgi:hypothetical protein